MHRSVVLCSVGSAWIKSVREKSCRILCDKSPFGIRVPTPGIQERIHALGGELTLASSQNTGMALSIFIAV